MPIEKYITRMTLTHIYSRVHIVAKFDRPSDFDFANISKFNSINLRAYRKKLIRIKKDCFNLQNFEIFVFILRIHFSRTRLEWVQ